MASPSAERFTYAHVIEGLVKHALKDRLTPQILEHVARMGVDLRKTLDPQYSEKVWMPCLQYLAREMAPGLTQDDALHRLGEDFVVGYMNTMVGLATTQFLRMLGPKRALLRVKETFRSGTNYTEAKVTVKGPGQIELWMNEPIGWQAYIGGILSGMMKAVGAKDCEVKLLHRQPEECTFLVTWAEKG